MKQCPNCKNYTDDYSKFCNNCGHNFESAQQGPVTPPDPAYQPFDTYNAFDACGPEGKSRGITALLAIFLGGFGIQYLYLGKGMGMVYSILLSIVTCGTWSLVAFIQGLVMLFMTNAQFYQKYVATDKSFPLF